MQTQNSFRTPQEILPAYLFVATLEEQPCGLYFITNGKGYTAAITNYGARVVGLWVPDKKGKLTDIVVGMGTAKEYLESPDPYYGAVIGRYANRIKGGKFTIDDTYYELECNNNGNCLHSGSQGFHNRFWEIEEASSDKITMNYFSQDGEGGFPGGLKVSVQYTISSSNSLEIQFEYECDKPTHASLTNHNFWNLNGEGSGSILHHALSIDAASFLTIDEVQIPVSQVTVAGTPFDFRKERLIGGWMELKDQQLILGSGYDHNFILDKGFTAEPIKVAVATGDISGIRMETWTTEPGLQFYTGNFMSGINTFKSGCKDNFQTAFCLETQHYPDTPNHPGYPTTLLEPGKIYRSSTLYRFS